MKLDDIIKHDMKMAKLSYFYTVLDKAHKRLSEN
jgi:hypothetical protein